ncbi:cell division protein ZapA [Caloramator quimbayensis]|uniref:Cell division protein ZapA n=1 Tax=Caloramator quimbayensis TaxID=1147123 RepID=A0A1T4XHJ3_9CLOT|nr:cell division protein ZapA [Caloramator quimbayensis]SKA89019.1 cell division protein ZapA [Caloramator quimbayensis]
MPKNKVAVRINGAEYVLTGDESEAYLFSIANYIDKKIKETLSNNPKHSNSSAAVLAALTVADELFKIKKEIENIKKTINEPEEKLSKIKAEYDELYNAYAAMAREYEEYKSSQEGITEDINALKTQYEELYSSYLLRNEEFDNLEKENAYLKEQNDIIQSELEKSREEIANLKDELLENQIELVRVKKELKDLQNRKRNI